MANKIRDRRYTSLVLAIALFRIDVTNESDSETIDNILDSQEIKDGIRLYSMGGKRYMYDTYLVREFIIRLRYMRVSTGELSRGFNGLLGFETPRTIVKDVNKLIDILVERGATKDEE